jgi:hypothetical protein
MMMSELLQIRRIVSGGYNTTMKVVNTTPGIGNPMTEEERKDFMPNDENKLLARIELIDETGEPNVIPTGYYFDIQPNAKQYSIEKRNGLFVSETLEGAFI